MFLTFVCTIPLSAAESMRRESERREREFRREARSWPWYLSFERLSVSFRCQTHAAALLGAPPSFTRTMSSRESLLALEALPWQ